MAERVRRRAAHGVGECAEVRRHFTDVVQSYPRNRFTAKGYKLSSVRLWRDARRRRASTKVFPTVLFALSMPHVALET